MTAHDTDTSSEQNVFAIAEALFRVRRSGNTLVFERSAGPGSKWFQVAKRDESPQSKCHVCGTSSALASWEIRTAPPNLIMAVRICPNCSAAFSQQIGTVPPVVNIAGSWFRVYSPGKEVVVERSADRNGPWQVIATRGESFEMSRCPACGRSTKGPAPWEMYRSGHAIRVGKRCANCGDVYSYQVDIAYGQRP